MPLLVHAPPAASMISIDVEKSESRLLTKDRTLGAQVGHYRLLCQLWCWLRQNNTRGNQKRGDDRGHLNHIDGR